MNSDAETDRALIAEFVRRQRDAWNLGDAKSFSDAFLPDGCFVNVLGALTYGREPFEAQHAKILHHL